MNLNDCPLHTKARIVDPAADQRFSLRLQELGIRPGAEFTKVNRSSVSGVVMNVGGTRIAIDHRSARRMIVEAIK